MSAAVNSTVDTAGSLLSGTPSIHVALRGETLSGLAARYLGDGSKWRDIARANAMDDPFDLLTPAGHALAGKPGLTLEDLAGESWVLGTPGSDCSSRQIV